jgi:tetratricopeptide (TPR) repeat protein
MDSTQGLSTGGLSANSAENARNWYATGIGWIEKEAANLGLTYLERAIPLFEELGDALRATRARHHRLIGLQRTERHDEVETGAQEVLEGYGRLDDGYGQALAHAHLAESIARLGRWERAMTHLNLAEAIAAARRENAVLRYALERQARLFLERESSVQAVRLLKRAEALATEEGLESEAARHRAAQGAALARMGERSEAVGLLEDAQRRLIKQNRYREALESLAMLGRIYESTGQFEEQNRTKELMHLCGQQVIKSGDERKRRRALGEPPVDNEVLAEIPAN